MREGLLKGRFVELWVLNLAACHGTIRAGGLVALAAGLHRIALLGGLDMQPRLYPIKDSQYFRTGQAPDGTQLLVAPFGDEVIALRFDGEGRLLGVETYASDPDSKDGADREVECIVREAGIKPGIIWVQKFTIPERELAICEMPDYLQEFADSPSSFPADRAVHLAKALEQWKAKQGFVLVWGEDYEMDNRGEVEST
jgi:hypothetical protein